MINDKLITRLMATIENELSNFKKFSKKKNNKKNKGQKDQMDALLYNSFNDLNVYISVVCTNTRQE